MHLTVNVALPTYQTNRDLLALACSSFAPIPPPPGAPARLSGSVLLSRPQVDPHFLKQVIELDAAAGVDAVPTYPRLNESPLFAVCRSAYS